MSREKLTQAKEYIQAKEYEKARRILVTLPDSPIAEKWLAKLDEIAPSQSTSVSTKSNGSGLLQTAAVGMACLLIGGAGGFLASPRSSSAALPAPEVTPDVVVVWGESCELSEWLAEIRPYQDVLMDAIADTDPDEILDAADGMQSVPTPDCEIARQIRADTLQAMWDTAQGLQENDFGLVLAGTLTYGAALGRGSGYLQASVDILDSQLAEVETASDTATRRASP